MGGGFRDTPLSTLITASAKDSTMPSVKRVRSRRGWMEALRSMDRSLPAEADEGRTGRGREEAAMAREELEDREEEEEEEEEEAMAMLLLLLLPMVGGALEIKLLALPLALLLPEADSFQPHAG